VNLAITGLPPSVITSPFVAPSFSWAVFMANHCKNKNILLAWLRQLEQRPSGVLEPKILGNMQSAIFLKLWFAYNILEHKRLFWQYQLYGMHEIQNILLKKYLRIVGLRGKLLRQSLFFW
jgi:hypothetical protein